MNWQYTPYIIPLAIAAEIAIALAIYGWRRRRTPAAIPFTLAMSALALWSLGYALRLSSADLTSKVLWAKMRYPGIFTIPAAWLIFTLQYTGNTRWLTRRNIIWLAGMGG